MDITKQVVDRLDIVQVELNGIVVGCLKRKY